MIAANRSPEAWTPTPAVSVVHVPVSSHRASALPLVGHRSAGGVAPHRAFRAVRYFEAAVIRFTSGLRICLPPPVAPTATTHARMAAVTCTSEPRKGRYLPSPRIC